MVLNYGHMSIVLIDVSWVAEHSEMRPRLRRDEHGFWLANVAARPRDRSTPYLLPALASQVRMPKLLFVLHCCAAGCSATRSLTAH